MYFSIEAVVEIEHEACIPEIAGYAFSCCKVGYITLALLYRWSSVNLLPPWISPVNGGYLKSAALIPLRDYKAQAKHLEILLKGLSWVSLYIGQNIIKTLITKQS